MEGLRRRATEKSPQAENSESEKLILREGDIVDRVAFEVKDDGRVISQGSGRRKSFLLADSFNFVPNRTYSVRIGRDTKPGKATGFIIVELVDAEEGEETKETKETEKIIITESEIASIPHHEDAMRQQAEHLRRPALQVALRLAHAEIDTRDISSEILSRARDMRDPESEGEKHRAFTTLGSAIFHKTDSADLFNAGIDTAVTHNSEKMREWFEGWEGEQPPLLPVMVIGTGPHGATFLSTYQIYAEEHKATAVDERTRIGGQFADAQRPVLRLNSRNRPMLSGERSSERNLPGTEQTINPLGTLAPLQISDLSGESYVTQDALAYATRFNTITSTENFAMGCEIVGLETVRRKDGIEVSRCTFVDFDSQKIFNVDVDQLVVAGGIGTDAFRFADANQLTERRLKREKGKLERGERPVVMSFPQMLQYFGDPSKRSPLKGVKTAVVSGDGDSANVAVGVILGYEPGSARMPIALDRVEKVYWVGQNIPTKEKWLDQVRARYAQIGLEFPREEIEGYYSRIEPVPNTKVSNIETLRRPDGDDDVVSVFSTEGAIVVNADLYIACNGFENSLPSVIAGAGPDSRRREAYTNETLRSATTIKQLFVPGAYIRSNDGKELRILKINNSIKDRNRAEYVFSRRGTVEQRAKVAIGPGFDTSDDSVRFRELIGAEFEDTTGVISIPQEETPYEELYDEEGFPVARRVKGTSIFFAGPAAELSVTDMEKKRAPVLEQIPENTAALFRYGRGTEILARLVAQEADGQPKERYDAIPGSPVLTLQRSSEKIVSGYGAFYSPAIPNAYHVENKAALQLALADYLAEMRFPPNLSEIQIVASLDPNQDEGFSQLRFEVDGLSVVGLNGSAATAPIQNWLSRIAEDQRIVNAIYREAEQESKKVRSKDSLRRLEVAQRTRRLNELLPSGSEVAVPQIKDMARGDMVITIPLRSSRANIQNMQYRWESATT